MTWEFEFLLRKRKPRKKEIGFAYANDFCHRGTEAQK